MGISEQSARPARQRHVRAGLLSGGAVVALVAALAAWPGVATAAATALYVATTGDDGNAGTVTAPLKTIQKAVDLAQPGDTIHLRGGTYAPKTNVQILKNGTQSAPITL